MIPVNTSFNPFPGLRPFRLDEDYLFFGREGQSEEILRRLRTKRFLAVVGISGSGKSSLIRAGLLPYIFGGFMSGASSHWRVAVFRPGNNPIENMAHALSDPSVLGQAGSGESDEAKSKILLEVTLRRSGLGLIEATRQAQLLENEHLLIVVDQFEELFRFGNATNAVHQQDDAAAFVKLLFEATRQNALPIYIVITMRSDFIGDCSRFRDLPEAVTAGLYLIPRMSREQRRKAIEEPVRVGNGSISRRLINRLLNDGGDDPDQLPSLQHALMRSWNYWKAHGADGQPIDLDDYMAVGGISAALSQHAEEAFEELPDERARAIAKRLFQSLTEKGPDNREVRRPTRLGDIAAMADAEVQEVIAVIDCFRREGRSFLTPPPDVELDEDSIIDISHESLIRGWGRLKAWVEEEYESAKMYRRLAETTTLYAEGKAGLWHDPDLSNALRWRENEKPTLAWAKCYHPKFDEAMLFLEESRQARDQAAAELQRSRRQKLRNARLFAATVMILFLAATAAAVYAFYEQKTATDNALRAQSEKKMAQEQEQTAQIQRKQALANQDMAIGFASTTVRGFSDLSDFVVGQHDVQGKFESVLKEAAKVHDSVLQREPNNFPASIMRINALSALSRIHFVTGHTQAAEEECEKLEVEATKLAETSTDDMHRILAAYMLASASRTRRELQQTDRARADLKTAAQIADTVHSGKLINGNAGDQQVLRCLSIVYSAAGNFHGENDDLKAAISYYRKAIHVLAQYEDEALPATRKGDLDDASREYLVLDIQALGSRQAKAHLKHEAVDTYSRGVRLATSWSQKSPGDADLMDALFWSYVGRGDVELDENQYISARQDFDRAKAVSGKELSQKTADGQYDAAVAEERLGNIEHYMAESEKDPEIQKKELQTAQKLHDKALEMFQQMKGGSGKDPAVEHYIGSEESNLGWDFSGLGQSPEAKEQYKKSIPSLQLTADVLQTDEALSAVARAYRTLAELELDSNDYKEASQNFEEAIVAEKKLVAPDSNARHLILQDTKHLADSEFQNQKVDDSLKRYGGSIEDAEKWTQSTAASSDLFKDIIWLYLGRGDIELSQNAYPEAEKDFGSARDNLKHLDLASVDGKYIKSCVLERFGLLWKQRADAETDRARMNDDLLRAKTFQDDAANERHQIEGAGTSAEIEKSIGITEQNLGMATYELKDYDAAHKYLAASAKAYQQVVLMHSTEQAKVDLEKAYRMLAAVDVDQGGEQLSQGNYSEASKDFESARSTAKQAEAAGVDGRFVRRHTEEYIANYWREKGRSEKDTAQREKDSRQALEADESFLKLSEQIAQTNKSADATQNVGKGEERVGLDYSYLGDTENARKSFRASLKTFEQLPPGDEATRAIAAAYGNLAQMELNLNNTLAAREAFGSEIELLMPLTENPHADPADKRSLAAALGVRSWENALLGDFWTALSDAEKGSFLDSKQMFIEVNKGDAYLLLGQPEAARKIYLAVVDRQPELRADILSDLNEMGSHPELKADPKVLASIRSELTNHKPSNPQGVASKQ